ncbi:hypothetical protein BT63DRAFT_93599 [Microthyrium microscopicum]|uniref:Uncharacterized protein n=1 Tax=Microthyrium microscopicum TaxID=703497 RepID=A0A6A6U032_9PEZI|nr:hypothetical protein BT63DRAFT_93599 [Microthyrium microscopicum]
MTLIYFILPSIAMASPHPMSSVVNKTMEVFLPHRGNGTLVDELSCYSLPYGGIGFAGHVLTYWTCALLIGGRRPFMPWRSLERKSLDLCLDALSLFLTIPFALLSIYRCRSAWQFVLLAVWKTTLAVSLSAISFQRSWTIPKDIQTQRVKKATALITGASNSAYQQIPNTAFGDTSYVSLGTTLNEPKPGFASPIVTPLLNSPILNKPSEPDYTSWQTAGPGLKLSLLWWLFLYFLGTIVGLVGLFPIISASYAHKPQVREVTNIFIGIGVGPTVLYVLGVVLWKLLERPKPNASGMKVDKAKVAEGVMHTTVAVTILVIWAGMLAAFYSDWVLGAIAGDLAGRPSAANKPIYWTYFLAKRIPFFSL